MGVNTEKIQRHGNMTREHLETFTREELIDLVLQLQARLAELEARLVSKRG